MEDVCRKDAPIYSLVLLGTLFGVSLPYIFKEKHVTSSFGSNQNSKTQKDFLFLKARV